MSTDPSFVFKRVFSFYGLKMMIALLALGVIYRFAFTYIELKLGILNLGGKYDFEIIKLEKSLIFGLILVLISVGFYKLFPFKYFILNVFKEQDITYK